MRTSTQRTAVTVTPSQATRICKALVREGLPLMLVGSPGLGKTSIGKQVADSLGFEFIVTHPVVSDPTDYKGMPWVRTTERGSEADFLPFGDLLQMINAPRPTLVMLDDLGQAPPAVQAALMQVLLARRVNGHKISDHVRFIACTNRREDRAGVSGILEPVKGRFATILHLEADVDAWVEWALDQGLPPEVIAFIRFRPELLSAFEPTAEMTNTPTPRNVESVGSLLGAGLEERDLFPAIAGACGRGWATEFLAFRRAVDSIPDPDDIIAHPGSAMVPREPSTLYALCGALARMATLTNWNPITVYIKRLPAEFGLLAMTLAVGGNKDLARTPEYTQWVAENHELITG